MAITTISGRDFARDAASAQRAAAQGPVIVVDAGRPTYVLLTYDRYLELTAPARDIVSLLGMPEAVDIELEDCRVDIDSRPAELG